ncbi:MAG: hypothetical protein ACI4XF_11210 [Oscillospiraceae bacterium]
MSNTVALYYAAQLIIQLFIFFFKLCDEPHQSLIIAQIFAA